jgi:hypothetical protein
LRINPLRANAPLRGRGPAAVILVIHHYLVPRGVVSFKVVQAFVWIVAFAEVPDEFVDAPVT